MIRFNINLDILSLQYEIYEDEKLIYRQIIDAIYYTHKQQYIDLLHQLAGDSRPMRLKISMIDTIWDEFEKKEKNVENYLEFKNNAYLTIHGRDEADPHK